MLNVQIPFQASAVLVPLATKLFKRDLSQHVSTSTNALSINLVMMMQFVSTKTALSNVFATLASRATALLAPILMSVVTKVSHANSTQTATTLLALLPVLAKLDSILSLIKARQRAWMLMSACLEQITVIIVPYVPTLKEVTLVPVNLVTVEMVLRASMTTSALYLLMTVIQTHIASILPVVSHATVRSGLASRATPVKMSMSAPKICIPVMKMLCVPIIFPDTVVFAKTDTEVTALPVLILMNVMNKVAIVIQWPTVSTLLVRLNASV